MSGPIDVTSTRDCGTVSTAFNVLLERCGKTVKQVSNETGINDKVLYGIAQSNRSKADMRVLKRLAAYFGVDMVIFAGIEDYVEPFRPTQEEIALLEKLRAMPQQKQQQALSMMNASEEEMAIVEQYRGLSPKMKVRVSELLGVTEKEFNFIHTYRSLTDETQKLVEGTVNNFAQNPSNHR